MMWGIGISTIAIPIDDPKLLPIIGKMSKGTMTIEPKIAYADNNTRTIRVQWCITPK
jgi:hypothetical protein